MNKIISLLALAAVLAVSAGPAFATTRPETPPQTEHKGDGDSERETVEYRLPNGLQSLSQATRCRRCGRRWYGHLPPADPTPSRREG